MLGREQTQGDMIGDVVMGGARGWPEFGAAGRGIGTKGVIDEALGVQFLVELCLSGPQANPGGGTCTSMTPTCDLWPAGTVLTQWPKRRSGAYLAIVASCNSASQPLRAPTVSVRLRRIARTMPPARSGASPSQPKAQPRRRRAPSLIDFCELTLATPPLPRRRAAITILT